MLYNSYRVAVTNQIIHCSEPISENINYILGQLTLKLNYFIKILTLANRWRAKELRLE